MIFWLLSIATAAVGCLFGNLDPMRISSNLVFHRNLRKLGTGNSFLSNFHRKYGWKGWLKYAAVELITDLFPILLGGLLFSMKGEAESGRILAGFCVTFCRMYPLLNDLKGTNGLVPMLLTLLCVNATTFATTLVLMGACLVALRYYSLSIAAGGIIAAITGAIVIDETLTIRIVVLMGILVFVRNFKGLLNGFFGREERFSFKKDITYKLDERL